MSAAEGDQAPDFEMPASGGRTVSLAAMRGKPFVLYFYPKADTPGCTKEACHFRDLAAEFGAVGAQRLGISTDPVAKQKQFADAHGFDYPVLSDESGDVARAFGVKRRMITPVKRATFVIDPDRTVRTVVTSELDMAVHADRALAALRPPQAQADPRAVGVDLQNFEGIGLADLYGVFGLLDTTFGQLGNMHQPIFADADINEHTKLGDAGNGAFNIIADPQRRQLLTIQLDLLASTAARLAGALFCAHRQADPPAIRLDALDPHFDSITNLDDVAR